MFTIIFVVALIWLAWKMLVMSVKAAWGIAKMLCIILLLPAFIIGLVCGGLIYLAIPVLIVAGIIVIIGNIAEA